MEDLTLGMMPVYCGDKASDYDPEAAEARTREIAAMLKDDIHIAPLFSQSLPFVLSDYGSPTWMYWITNSMSSQARVCSRQSTICATSGPSAR